MNALIADRFAIREAVENWAIWRDAGDWERFATLWHPEGIMMATWFQGTGLEFIQVTQEGWARGVSILHFLGGTSVDLVGTRAIAQTKMTISQRGDIDGHRCDVVCTGRFYDFYEKLGEQWLLRLRQPIYEKDRVDSVESGVKLDLEPEILGGFPEGYRHLAYMQTKIGYTVKRDMPGITGAAVDALYAKGRAWLETGKL